MLCAGHCLLPSSVGGTLFTQTPRRHSFTCAPTRSISKSQPAFRLAWLRDVETSAPLSASPSVPFSPGASLYRGGSPSPPLPHLSLSPLPGSPHVLSPFPAAMALLSRHPSMRLLPLRQRLPRWHLRLNQLNPPRARPLVRRRRRPWVLALQSCRRPCLLAQQTRTTKTVRPVRLYVMRVSRPRTQNLLFGPVERSGPEGRGEGAERKATGK